VQVDEQCPPGTYWRWLRYVLSSTAIDLFFWPMLKGLEYSIALCLSRRAIPSLSADQFTAASQVIAEMAIVASVMLCGWLLIRVWLCNLAYNSQLPPENHFYSRVVAQWFSMCKINKIFRQPFHSSGMPWDASFKRLIGAEIGQDFFSASDRMNGGLIDLVFARIGDGVTLDYDAVICQHTFEDMKLKWGPKQVASGTTLSQASLLAMAETNCGATLSCASVTWKGQTLEGQMLYEGAPASPIEER